MSDPFRLSRITHHASPFNDSTFQRFNVSMPDLSPWLILLGLGAFHGLNPAMGWLFAVALGFQEQRRAAVWNALPPIALGHALSIAVIVGVVLLARISLPHSLLKWSSAAILLGFGLYRLV